MNELNRLLVMDLQLLAEGEEQQGLDTEEATLNMDKEEEEKVDPRLSPKYSIEDLNAIIKKEKAKWQRKEQRKEEEQQLSPEEQQKLQLAEKEKELLKRELKINAQSELVKRNIPLDLIDLLDYSDEDACEESMKQLETAFEKALSKAVAEKLKDQAPIKKGGEPNKKNALQEQIRAGLRKKY